MPIALAPGLTLSNPQTATISSAVVSIGPFYIAGRESLIFANQNGITGNFNAATGQLTLAGSTSMANYQAALRSVTYANESTGSLRTTRSVSFAVVNAVNASSPTWTNVNSRATNAVVPVVLATTPPRASLLLSGSPFAENGGAATVQAVLSGTFTQSVTVNLSLGGMQRPASITRRVREHGDTCWPNQWRSHAHAP